MDTIRSQFTKPLVIGIAGVILGIILGLIWGYVIDPVEYFDAAVEHLRVDLQEDYLRMAIDSYAVNNDVALAHQRYVAVGDKGLDLLAKIQSNPGTQNAAVIDKFIFEAVGGQAAQVTPGATQPPAPAGETQVAPVETPLTEAPKPGEGQPATGTEEKPAKGTSPLVTLLLVFCGITLLLGIGLAVVYLLRSRGSSGGTGVMTPAMQAAEAAKQAQWTDYEAGGEETPMAQFMASYKLGDDLFDDSFSIDSASGEFMGECGVGISETIGVGDPKKVTAFEVWLFDKNDIQTVTKVMMSAHAFRDEAMRQRLSAKGEPVLAEPGGQAVLETATLRLVAKIVDMNYGEGALPDKSFFDNLILEIAVWQK